MSSALDTSQEAARVQRAVFAGKSGAERVAMALEMSELVHQLVREGIARRHPDATEAELQWHFLERLHGKKIADEVSFGRER